MAGDVLPLRAVEELQHPEDTVGHRSVRRAWIRLNINSAACCLPPTAPHKPIRCNCMYVRCDPDDCNVHRMLEKLRILYSGEQGSRRELRTEITLSRRPGRASYCMRHARPAVVEIGKILDR